MDSIIKQLRRKHKISQEALANHLHTSRQTIISIERGRYTPSLPLAYKLSRFFELPIEELFDLSIFDSEVISISQSNTTR